MVRKVAVLTVMLATALAVVACGGSSPKHDQTASNSTPQHSAGMKLAHCMRTHGVPDFPDPSSGSGFGIQSSRNGDNATVSVDGRSLKVSGPAFQKAMQSCGRYGPQGPPLSGAQLAKVRQGALRMAQCMRRHGVTNFPDPRITTAPGGHGIGVQIGGPGSSAGGQPPFNPRSPAFQRAQQACGGVIGFGPVHRKPGS